MPVDVALLESLRSFEDPRSGIAERLLTPRIGGASSVAVLSTPLAGKPTMGWLICSSYGAEQQYLMRPEVRIARTLAAKGFAVLRYHGQGYGDSERGAEHISPASHRADALDAAGILRSETVVEHVGLLGIRFGATTALMVAADSDSQAVVAVEPVLRGRTYVRSVLARSHALRFGGNAASNGAKTTGIPGAGDVLDVEGDPVSRASLRDLEAMDALGPAERFMGASVILGVGRTAEPSEGLRTLADALGGRAGRAKLDVVAHPAALWLAVPSRRGQDSRGKAELWDLVIERVETWCNALASQAAGDVS